MFNYLVTAFPIIQSLGIRIDLANYSSVWPANKDSDGMWMPGILSLRHLPLRTVTVIIRDHGRKIPRIVPNRIRGSLEKKQLWARYIRNRLLKPKEHHERPKLSYIQTSLSKKALSIEK